MKPATEKIIALRDKLRALALFSPSASAYNVVNRAHASTEPLCYNSDRTHSLSVHRPYLPNLIPSKFRASIQFSYRAQFRVATVPCSISACLPSLAVPVGIIVLDAAKKKMMRVTTSRIVATVKHPHSARNFTVCDVVCDPVSAISFFGNSKSAVTVLVCVVAPIPARSCISTLNKTPKSNNVLLAKVDYWTRGQYLIRSIWHVYSMLIVRAVSLLTAARRLAFSTLFPRSRQQTIAGELAEKLQQALPQAA